MNFECSRQINTLLWRHNGHDSVSNHQPYDCFPRRLFRRRSKQTSNLLVTSLCVGNSPGPVNFPHKWPVTRKMFPFDDVIMTWTSANLLSTGHLETSVNEALLGNNIYNEEKPFKEVVCKLCEVLFRPPCINPLWRHMASRILLLVNVMVFCGTLTLWQYGASDFFVLVWTSGWTNSRVVDDLRHHGSLGDIIGTQICPILENG